MTRLQNNSPVTAAFGLIVGGYLLLWVPEISGVVIGRRLGLAGLEWQAVVSLAMSMVSIGLLLVFSADARRVCGTGLAKLGERKTRIYLAVVIGLYALGFILHFVLYKLQLAPSGIAADVGWSHYFSLPAGRRPDFLLHYLVLSAVKTVLTAPLAEELFHIGVVVGVLRRYNIPWPWIYVFDAVLFVILHYSHGILPTDMRLLVVYAFARLFLDGLFRATGNISVPIVAHMLNNLRVVATNWFPLVG